MKRSVPKILLAAALSFTLTPAHAQPQEIIDGRYADARPVSGTPFDSRLAKAGFFARIRPKRNAKAHSTDELFRIARSFRYSPDADQDQWQSASETDAKKEGDCEDKAIWLYTQLRLNGYRNVCLTVGRYRPYGPKLHAWVTYMDPTAGNISLLDPTVQMKPWNVDDFPKDLYRPLFGFSEKGSFRF